MATAATAAGRNKRKAHTGQTVRASTNFVNNSNLSEYNLNAHRVQRLIATAGISPSIAAVMAPFIFGGAA